MPRHYDSVLHAKWSFASWPLRASPWATCSSGGQETCQPWKEPDSPEALSWKMAVSSNLGKQNEGTREGLLSRAWMKTICHLPYSLAAFCHVHFWGAGILCFQLIFIVQMKDPHVYKSFINSIYGHSQSQSITQTETQCSGASGLRCSWEIVREEHGIIGREAGLIIAV